MIFRLMSLSRRSQQSQRSNRNHQVPGSLNCIYFLETARIVVIKWKPACSSWCTKIPVRFQFCLIDPAGNNTKSETGISPIRSWRWCRKTRFEASRVVFWSLSFYKELKLTTNWFTGRTLRGLLIQMQNISLRSSGMRRKPNFDSFWD